MRRRGSGWHGESHRHRLSAYGIKTDIVYRGTTAGSSQNFKSRYRPQEQLGFGIHFTESKELADMYAFDKKIARRGKEPYVHHAILHMENPLIANKIYFEGEPEFKLAEELIKGTGYRLNAMKDERGIRGLYLQNYIDMTSPQRAEMIIKEHEYDGVIYNARLIEPDVYTAKLIDEAESYIVFEPEQIEIIGGHE